MTTGPETVVPGPVIAHDGGRSGAGVPAPRPDYRADGAGQAQRYPAVPERGEHRTRNAAAVQDGEDEHDYRRGRPGDHGVAPGLAAGPAEGPAAPGPDQR